MDFINLDSGCVCLVNLRVQIRTLINEHDDVDESPRDSVRTVRPAPQYLS